MTTSAEKIAETTIEKPAEKRRALGRGLDSLLPVGPRVVAGRRLRRVPEPAMIWRTCTRMAGDAGTRK